MTCYHVLKEEELQIGNEIKITLDDDKYEFMIKINESKAIYTNPNLDVTIIEVYKNEYPNINAFLSIDEQIFQKKPYKDYKNNPIYLLHYQEGVESHYSDGIIKSISEDTNIINHNCGSKGGSSGGPLINSINFKVIGIHTGEKLHSNLNTGIFIKPVIDDFFKYLTTKKVNFDDKIEKEKIELKNFDDKSGDVEIEMNDEKKSGKDNNEYLLTNNNSDKPLLNKSKTSKRNLPYYFVLIMGFLIGMSFENVSDALFSWKEHDTNIDLEFYFMYLFLILLYDMICGCLLYVIQLFLNNKIILALSIFLVPLFHVRIEITAFSFLFFLLSPYLSVKFITSSFFHIIPFFDPKIIRYINIGEVLASIINILLPTNRSKNENEYTNNDKFKLGLLLVAAILCFAYISIYYNKLNKNIKFNFELKYLLENKFLIFLLFINYSFTYSYLPFYALKGFDVGIKFIYVIGDIIGRLSHKILNNNFYTPVVFFRFIICIFTYFSFTIENFSFYIEIFLLGILSGSSTSIGYYLPLNTENEKEKDNLLYYVKNWKYYAIKLLIDNNNKNQ